MTRHYIILVLATAMAGCSSFSSTLLHRTEDNSAWDTKRMLRGVPITLKVPTHVRIDVAEKHFLVQEVEERECGKKFIAIRRKVANFPLREVTYNMIMTEKMFVVDVKRPGAGTINAKLDFDADEQYFKEIKTKVVDETIEEVGNLIAQVVPGGLFGAPTADTAGAEVKGRVKQVSTVVASNIFQIDAPDFELQVRGFLDRHLNCCHDCGVLPMDTVPPVELPPPSMYEDASRRVMIPPHPDHSVELESIAPGITIEYGN